jgi:hypothetical protein
MKMFRSKYWHGRPKLTKEPEELLTSEMWRRVFWYNCTDISEELTASVSMVEL